MTLVNYRRCFANGAVTLVQCSDLEMGGRGPRERKEKKRTREKTQLSLICGALQATTLGIESNRDW